MVGCRWFAVVRLVRIGSQVSLSDNRNTRGTSARGELHVHVHAECEHQREGRGKGEGKYEA